MQYNRLAFVAGLNRATDEGSLPEIAQYSPYILPLNVLLLPKDLNFVFYSFKNLNCGQVSLTATVTCNQYYLLSCGADGAR